MNKREIVVYISGKYSGNFKGANPISKFLNYIQIACNIWQARKLAIQVWEAGFTALCPHTNSILMDLDCSCGYNDYLGGDLHLVDRSDCVLFVDNWKDSYGANREYIRAKNKPRFYDIETLKEYYK